MSREHRNIVQLCTNNCNVCAINDNENIKSDVNIIDFNNNDDNDNFHIDNRNDNDENLLTVPALSATNQCHTDNSKILPGNDI